jgi:VanZ family protein
VSRLPLRDFAWPRLWFRLWLVLLALTLVVCLVPLPSVPVRVSNFDKIGHWFGYTVLSAYAAMLFGTRRGVALAALGLCLFGAAIEGLQALVPWRSTDLLDGLSNAGGVALGALLWFTPAAGALLWVDRRMR